RLFPVLQASQGLAQEPLRCLGAAGRRQVEIDRVAPLVDCPVQVGPLAPHLDVGFIQAPARIKATPPEPAQPLLHLRGVALDPAIDRRMVDRNAAFRQHFLKVAIADRIATIPAHRPQDHITLEMAPLEIRHRSVRPISAKHAQASRFLQQSLESRRRHFPKALRRMVVLRDDTCRTPYCDGSIQDIDHALPAREGGPTNWQNGSGLCAACNQIKENTGWRHEATPEQLTVTTPTGHQYAKPTGPVLEGIPPDTRAFANQEPSSQVRSSTDCYAAKPHRPIVLTLAA